MQSAWRHLPHAITLLALACGCSALHFVHTGQIDRAGIAILAAAVLDALDGIVARRFKLETPEGLQLDSLADLVNFGVAPAFLIFESYGAGFGAVGAMASLAYVIAACLRLAKYNVTTLAATQGRMGRASRAFRYTGITSTAAAVLCLIALRLSPSHVAGEIAIAAQFILAAAMLGPWPFPTLATVISAIASVVMRR